MFKVNKIVKRNKKQQRDMRVTNSMVRTEAEYLEEKYKKILLETQDELEEATKQMEEETGWRYIGHGFECLSNFIYNALTEEIEFIESAISFKDGVFAPVHNTRRECEFNEKNREQLKRVEMLIRKRDWYEAFAYDDMTKAIESEPPTVEVFHTPTPYQVKAKEQEYDMEMLANNFYDEYGNDGLVLVIKWLNRLANEEKPSKIFDELLKEDVPQDLKEQVLFWVSQYLVSGEQLLERFKKENPVRVEKKEEQKGK